mmetsp:Transcript_95718/g.151447  ORF Transcript_95718/g.151447 Transcript_95718/m.151447 type:complete len:732 (+) Transcript_95718:66-2261(+)
MICFSVYSVLFVFASCGHSARIQLVKASRVKATEMQEGIKNRKAALMEKRRKALGTDTDEAAQYQTDQRTNVEHIIREQRPTVALLDEMPFEQVSPTYLDDSGKSQPRKQIFLLGNALPPVWPHRLGTLRFLTNRGMTLHPDDADGLLETNDAGTPLANGLPCGQPLQAHCPVIELVKDAEPVDIPFNTQLEDLEFRKTVGDHWWSGPCSACTPPGRDRYVTTDCCTYVDNFDTALFTRAYKKGNGIMLGSGSGLKEVDFAVHWEVSTMNFGESIPVVAPQAFIGFGVDGSDTETGSNVILDLGMAFYSCDSSNSQPTRDNLQDCTYKGMLNFETEANHAKGNRNGLYAEAWPGFPGRVPDHSRVRRCTNLTRMCADQPDVFSGLLFKEKVEGAQVAEYSGELIGGGGDGDDSFMYLDLDGLKRLGVTHALLTGHEYNRVTLSKLTGAFYRLAAGKVVEKKGHMQTILYQDLDEAKEPPTPQFPAGAKTDSNAMLLGVFSLRGDADWSFGEMPKAAEGSHWQFTVLNTPIKGRRLSESTREIADVLNRQILPVPLSEQPALNELIGTALDLGMNGELVAMTGADDVDGAYQRLPGGAPGAATRNYHFLPEASVSKVLLNGVSNAQVCAGKKLTVSIGRASWETGVVAEDGSGSIVGSRSINVQEKFGRFSSEIIIACGGEPMPSIQRDLRRTLPPSVFTAPWADFWSTYALSDPTSGITLHFEVKVLSSEW